MNRLVCLCVAAAMACLAATPSAAASPAASAPQPAQDSAEAQTAAGIGSSVVPVRYARMSSEDDGQCEKAPLPRVPPNLGRATVSLVASLQVQNGRVVSVEVRDIRGANDRRLVRTVVLYTAETLQRWVCAGSKTVHRTLVFDLE
jgi:hypothetical protein